MAEIRHREAVRTPGRLATAEERTRFDYLLLIVASGWGAYGVAYGLLLGHWQNGTVDIIEVITTLVIRRWGLATGEHRRLLAACHFEATIAFAGIMTTSMVLGQNESVPSWFLAPLPLFVAYLSGVRASVIWAAISVAGATALWASEYLVQMTPEFIPDPLIICGSRIILIVISTALGIAARRVSDRQLDQLRVTTAAAEAANKAKSAFLANMSHELRTPLNAIIGFTGTLLMRLPGPLTRDQEEQLHIVKSSAQHLLLLINDVLDLAKIESGRMDMNPQEVICQTLVEEIAATLKPTADGKKLIITVEMPETPLTVHADRRALTQIVLNLASNAIRFTEVGGVKFGVRTLLRKDEPLVEISVVDTGIGIRAEDQQLLFKSFSQVNSISDGTGLGLHLSQQFARLIGGWIEFESEYGKGSRFALMLPISRAD